jgi:hypothetical protein
LLAAMLLFFCYAFFATQKKAFGDKNKQGRHAIACFISGYATPKACLLRMQLCRLVFFATLLAPQEGDKKQGEGLLLSVRCLFRRIFSI